jgi:hypothetical protein
MHCLCTAYALPMHCLFTAYSLPIHCLFTAYSLPIHCLFNACAMPMHCLCTAYALPMHCLFTPYSLPLPFQCLCVACALPVRCLCAAYALPMCCLCADYALTMHCLCAPCPLFCSISLSRTNPSSLLVPPLVLCIPHLICLTALAFPLRSLEGDRGTAQLKSCNPFYGFIQMMSTVRRLTVSSMFWWLALFLQAIYSLFLFCIPPEAHSVAKHGSPRSTQCQRVVLRC